ncbi:MAG: hypothetical protein ACYC5M_02290 [Anaerolineae bacterium]
MVDSRCVINTYNEKALHAALKAWYAQPGDLLEEPVDGYLIDIVRGDLMVEIQTRGLGALRSKLADLLPRHPVRLVYPVARTRWIVRLAEDGVTALGRRRSPKQGGLEDLFDELVGLPHLLWQPGFSIEVLLTEEDEVRRSDARRWRRHGWAVEERRLLGVVDRRTFETPDDLGALLPGGLPEPFSTADLAEALGRPRRLAQRMAYCLRVMGVLRLAGKRGRALLYAPGEADDAAERTGSVTGG